MSKTAKKKQPQAHHAATAAQHCTNHYTRSVMQLESVVEERLAQLNLLAQENSALKRREAALQSAVGSLAGSVSAATRAVLVSSAIEAADALHAVRPVSPEVRCSIADHKSFLLCMQQRETAVQRIMSQLGCVESDELYSSWLLRRAFSNPERAASHLAMSKVQRVAYVLATVQKLGLLVGKYDLLHHPSTAQGTPREQLDRLVDDLNERTLAFCLLAPPNRQLEMACLNLETGLPEPYPRGWWAVVIDAMHLTDDQKAALKICWDKVKPIKLALTAKYETLSKQLAQLQRKQLDQQRQFELQAEHAIDAAINRQAAGSHQSQQDLLHTEGGGQQQLQRDQQQQQQGQPQQQWQQPGQSQMPWQPQQGQQQQQQWQWPQQQWPQQQWQQQQQSMVKQQQQQQQQDAGFRFADAADHDLFQFCRCLLGSEVDGVPVSLGSLGAARDTAGLAATSTSLQQQGASCVPVSSAAAAAAAGQQLECPGMEAPSAAAANGVVGMDTTAATAAAPPAAAVAAAPAAPQQQQQKQWYAARMAPLQQPQQQQQQHFMEFSPAVAAAAAASDLNLWLGADMMQGHSSPGALHAALGANLMSQSSDSQEGPSAGHELADESENMLVDGSSAPVAAAGGGGAGQASSSDASGGPMTSKSADTTSLPSKAVTPNSSPCAAGPAAVAQAAAPAAAAGSVQCGGSGSGNNNTWQGDAAGAAAAVVAGGNAAGLENGKQQGDQQQLVLQSTDKEQRKLEKQLDRITAQLKMQQYCMHTYVLNICSKKQMALKYVNCWPWVPESFSMCEALDEMGW